MSLFPKLDKEIEDLRAKEAELLQELIAKTKRFEPSNRSEASVVYDNLCSNCFEDNEDEEKYCDILATFSAGDYHEAIRETKDRVFCLKSSMFDIKDYKSHLKLKG